MKFGTLGLVLLIGLFWGLNWPAVKTLLTELPPFTIRAVALTVSGALLAVIAKALGHRLRPPRGELWPLLLAGLLTVFGFNVLVTFGQMLTETSKAAIIAYIMPALTAATVGVAVHGGAEVALQVADVFMTRDGLGPLAELLAGARRTLRVSSSSRRTGAPDASTSVPALRRGDRPACQSASQT